MLGRFVSALLLAASLAQAVDVDVVEQDAAASEHHFASKWYHDESHSVHSLFRRASNDEITYSPVGSPGMSPSFSLLLTPRSSGYQTGSEAFLQIWYRC